MHVYTNSKDDLTIREVKPARQALPSTADAHGEPIWPPNLPQANIYYSYLPTEQEPGEEDPSKSSE